eukprot:192101_1
MSTDSQQHEDCDWQPLVIDNGTHLIKAGFGGDDAPRAVFPTITGKQRHAGIFVGTHVKDCYVGDEAQSKRGILSLKYPMEHGLIVNWDSMTYVWHHTFYNELVVAPEEHPILLTDSALNTKLNRNKIAEIMFENFQSPSIYIVAQSPLSLYQSGKTTGVVINSGYDVTNIVPIYEGFVLNDTVTQLPIGGENLNRYLSKLLTESGYCFVRYWTCKELVDDIKIKHSYIAKDFENEMREKNDICLEYELPDGQKIEIDIERFKCCEPFFKPNLLGIESSGIYELLYESVMKCHCELRCDMFNNVLLSGGGMKMNGIEERIKKEMNEYRINIHIVSGYIRMFYENKYINKDIVNIVHNHCGIDVNVIAPIERKYSAWIGGSIVSCLANFKDRWVKKQEYDEYGATVVQRKCTGI